MSTTQITLRSWRHGDIESLVKYANNPKIARNLTDLFPHPYTRAHAEEFIERNSTAVPINVLAIDLDGEAIGAIGVHPQGDIMVRNAELGYWIGEPFWGQGIMTQAIEKMIKYAFDHFDIDRLYARPYGSNAASQRALEKCGFQLEARIFDNILKWGEREDELIYAVRRKPMFRRKHTYRVEVEWEGNRGTGTSSYTAYDRNHALRFAGKESLAGSADSTFRGDAARYNPEELIVSTLSSCHMLWYLHLCADAGIVVEQYIDKAEGVMVEGGERGGRFSEAILKPLVTIKNKEQKEQAMALHEDAHKKCFISNSINFQVRIEARIV